MWKANVNQMQGEPLGEVGDPLGSAGRNGAGVLSQAVECYWLSPVGRADILYMGLVANFWHTHQENPLELSRI